MPFPFTALRRWIRHDAGNGRSSTGGEGTEEKEGAGNSSATQMPEPPSSSSSRESPRSQSRGGIISLPAPAPRPHGTAATAAWLAGDDDALDHLYFAQRRAHRQAHAARRLEGRTATLAVVAAPRSREAAQALLAARDAAAARVACSSSPRGDMLPSFLGGRCSCCSCCAGPAGMVVNFSRPLPPPDGLARLPALRFRPFRRMVHDEVALVPSLPSFSSSSSSLEEMVARLGVGEVGYSCPGHRVERAVVDVRYCPPGEGCNGRADATDYARERETAAARGDEGHPSHEAVLWDSAFEIGSGPSCRDGSDDNSVDDHSRGYGEERNCGAATEDGSTHGLVFPMLSAADVDFSFDNDLFPPADDTSSDSNSDSDDSDATPYPRHQSLFSIRADHEAADDAGHAYPRGFASLANRIRKRVGRVRVRRTPAPSTELTFPLRHLRPLRAEICDASWPSDDDDDDEHDRAVLEDHLKQDAAMDPDVDDDDEGHEVVRTARSVALARHPATRRSVYVRGGATQAPRSSPPTSPPLPLPTSNFSSQLGVSQPGVSRTQRHPTPSPHALSHPLSHPPPHPPRTRSTIPFASPEGEATLAQLRHAFQLPAAWDAAAVLLHLLRHPRCRRSAGMILPLAARANALAWAGVERLLGPNSSPADRALVRTFLYGSGNGAEGKSEGEGEGEGEGEREGDGRGKPLFTVRRGFRGGRYAHLLRRRRGSLTGKKGGDGPFVQRTKKPRLGPSRLHEFETVG